MELCKFIVDVFSHSNSATYFVEYHFPASVVTMGHVEASSLARKRRPVPSHEVMRIASKKMKNGGT